MGETFRQGQQLLFFPPDGFSKLFLPWTWFSQADGTGSGEGF